jgi:hypothetical protein
LKQTIEDMPNLVVTEGEVSHKNNNISLSLRQQDLKDPVNTDSILLTFNPATDSTAGIILPSDKSKIDKIVTDGDGNKYLTDNGNYQELIEDTTETIKTTGAIPVAGGPLADLLNKAGINSISPDTSM